MTDQPCPTKPKKIRNWIVAFSAGLASVAILASAAILVHDYFAKQSTVTPLEAQLRCVERYVHDLVRRQVDLSDAYGRYINAKVNILAKATGHTFPKQMTDDMDLLKELDNYGKVLILHEQSEELAKQYESECSKLFR